MDLKKIFSSHNDEQTKQGEAPCISSDSRQEKETYKQYGFRMAGRCDGGLQTFIPCLHAVSLGLRKEQEEDVALQDALKADLQNRKINAENEKEREENNLQTSKDKQKKLEDELEEKKQELTKTKSDVFRRNREAWITLIITAVILVPFTLYFFIFYSSVGYSAFFKTFTLDNLGEDGNFKLAEAIFDSQALSNAMAEGFTAFLFILLMPIVFLAFGFILNRWEREKGWLKFVKIPLIIVGAFIFDALLSYEICEKIYNIHILTSLEDHPEYSIALAANDPKFWVIICLGFVSYLIWGITFSYFIKSLDQLDLNKILQDQLSKDIDVLNSKISDEQQRQNEMANKIADLRSEIQRIENQINGTLARYDINKIKLELNHFHAGWQQYLAGLGKPKSVKDEIAKGFETTLSALITNKNDYQDEK